ncbi:MAG: prepilin-type N-terminal cleavage/methylation domain-containing protein [Geothrix sp.]|uniref:PilW family protein n=1 Tax=Geothrix sp. TaxID=1962974 RepID=UPI0017F96B1D|nr:prepilin-type N-terminal cleavage/methylation domain-containing protein [Geothrix sp.]NWJ40128.1 prepilin-type N-terminal cleavage/methylation domain-containing protein [Geothrix sp.]WIL21863.1 MAG: prepilin-type N-terminal cleavage/methylation domain-containing protein [Geothrix sp.]
MTLRSFRRFRPLQQGFSLIEMLVAVMFIGFLTAGMLRVYSTNLAGFQRVNDTIASQRRGRWALASLQDDVASIGFFGYVGFNSPSEGKYSVVSGTQEPFMILPSPSAVIVTGPNPASPGTLVTGPLVPNPDELQYVSDIALPIQADLSTINSVGLTLSLKSGSLSDLRSGDIVAVLDSNFEQFIISGPSNTNAVTADLPATTQHQSMGGAYSVIPPGSKTHIGGVPLAFYRPSVVTRYSIQARSWDPSNPAITIPCLVRQQKAYPADGSLIAWAAVPVEVIAENIEGFRVDFSFDGGTTWVRSGAANWDAIVGKITTALAPLGATGVPARNAADPLWFRNYPFLIRMDVVSRSAAPRAENSDVTGQAAYVRRTQTLMVSPRNFGLPL